MCVCQASWTWAISRPSCACSWSRCWEWGEHGLVRTGPSIVCAVLARVCCWCCGLGFSCWLLGSSEGVDATGWCTLVVDELVEFYMYREPTEPPAGRPMQDVLLDLLHSDPEAFKAAHGEGAVEVLQAIMKLRESRGRCASTPSTLPAVADAPSPPH